MRTVPLQLLTWGTIACAVTSAVWLASTDQAPVFGFFGDGAANRSMGIDFLLPGEPTAAGKSKAIGPDAAGSMQAITG